MGFAYSISKEQYDYYMKICGTEENIIRYLNETLSLSRTITNIIVQK